MSHIKTIIFSVVLGVIFSATVTFAAAAWHGTDWITDGATIRADYIRDNFDTLYTKTLQAFIPPFTSWNSLGTGGGGAAIYNDASTYKKLMIVGNNSAGGVREVGVWDNLTVHGSAQVTGAARANTLSVDGTAKVKTLYVDGKKVAAEPSVVRVEKTTTAIDFNINCPTGKAVMTGGCSHYGYNRSIVQSYPTSNGWYCRFNASGGTQYGVVLCR